MSPSRKIISRSADHFFNEWILLSTKSKMKQRLFAFVFRVQLARTLFGHFVGTNYPHVQCCCDKRGIVGQKRTTTILHFEE